MYPIQKYRYFTNGNKVIAVSTYAGKTVRGVAICDSGDKFDLDKGKQLAAARCAVKIATKRYNRATQKVHEAGEKVQAAMLHRQKMNQYAWDASDEVHEAMENEAKLLQSF